MLAYKKVELVCQDRTAFFLKKSQALHKITKFKGNILESYPFDFQKRHLKALPFLKKPIFLQNKVHYMTLIIKPTTGYTSPLSSSFFGSIHFLAGVGGPVNLLYTLCATNRQCPVIISRGIHLKQSPILIGSDYKRHGI